MRYLALLLSFFLINCENHIYRTENINEQLHAFIFDGQKMYALGEHYDYLFENQDIIALQQFITSSFAPDILAVDLNFNGNDEKIFAEYAVYLDPKKYNQAEQNKLQQQFWFNPVSKIKLDVVNKIPASLNWKKDNPALKRQYRAIGKRVVLKNKDDLLAKYARNMSLNLTYSHHFSRQKVSEELVALTYFTLSLPIMTVWSLASLPTLIPIIIFAEK